MRRSPRSWPIRCIQITLTEREAELLFTHLQNTGYKVMDERVRLSVMRRIRASVIAVHKQREES